MYIELSINYDRISLNKNKSSIWFIFFVKLNFENMNMQN